MNCDETPQYPCECAEDCEIKYPDTGFASKKTWIASFYSYRAQAWAVATSTLSQEDADAKALAEAQRVAELKLELQTLPIGASQI